MDDLAIHRVHGLEGPGHPLGHDLLGLLAHEAPRWVSWALADFTVKLGFAALFLVPYRLLMNVLWPLPAPRTV